MSIWSDLLSLHGYVIRPHNDDAEPEQEGGPHRRGGPVARADRLPLALDSEPRASGPVLGVRGLA